MIQLGGMLVHLSGITLPKPPSWLTAGLQRLICHESPPKLFSGASLQVQSQQRTDALERLMMSMQNRQVWRGALAFAAVVVVVVFYFSFCCYIHLYSTLSNEGAW